MLWPGVPVEMGVKADTPWQSVHIWPSGMATGWCGGGRVGFGECRLTSLVSVEFGLLPSSDMCFSFPVEPFQKVLAGRSRCLFAVFLHCLLAMN